ncbi:MAG TPA: MmcQ/YjbR family DNA-binding protein [Trebonia sp.]
MQEQQSRPATVADVHAIAQSMPHVTRCPGRQENPIYQVGGKSFIFFRTPRPDARDPLTGERYDDVIVFWVESQSDKLSLVDDPDSPFFTTEHFNGHHSVLIRARDLGSVTYQELKEIIQDAWLSRASPARGRAWLDSQPPSAR